jgi:hypothetical protein
MMNMYDSKFDEGVHNLLQHSFSRVGRFPVMVVAADGQLERLVETVSAMGELRFVLEPLNAVSVWLQLDDIEKVAQQDWVTEIELARRTEVAEA